MCFSCPAFGPTACMMTSSPWSARRAFLLAAGAGAATPVLAQVDVGAASSLRKLVSAPALEQAAARQYQQMLSEAQARRVLVSRSHPSLQRLHAIARRLMVYAAPWNERARQWRWEVSLIDSAQINAFCMPGGKIVFYTGILEQLRLSDDEAAMVMGHEMAHALREHARERLAKTQGTHLALRLGAQLLGLGDLGQAAASFGGQLLTLKYGRSDESEADLVGLELAARGGFEPAAAVSLWRKMGQATGRQSGGPAFLSTHPTGPARIRELTQNLPKVQGLYEAARRGKAPTG
ncbi:M48 family metallopeptidase [Verminephrobacter eiseniae]|nr:M48 family metallopeptidase [Verminephrobacter sp. Larva24]MCW5232175.1 M48 family peptidase [Verminephrobacter eiseniae]MCW5283956.1 M48 family peptidase [Verminephrobacter eiseniae]MCW5296262.1 M48 family peptidase [Verminephrobacter eiseniae]MCW5301665.1 M48 family peptidase [Verminephrobacter eiseniae]